MFVFILFSIIPIALMGYMVLQFYFYSKMADKYENKYMNYKGVEVYVLDVYPGGRAYVKAPYGYCYHVNASDLQPLKTEIILFPTNQAK